MCAPTSDAMPESVSATQKVKSNYVSVQTDEAFDAGSQTVEIVLATDGVYDVERTVMMHLYRQRERTLQVLMKYIKFHCSCSLQTYP